VFGGCKPDGLQLPRCSQHATSAGLLTASMSWATHRSSSTADVTRRKSSRILLCRANHRWLELVFDRQTPEHG